MTTAVADLEASALGQLRQGVCLWSAAGRITSCNSAFAQALGLDAAAMRGLDVATLLDKAQRHGTLISWETPAAGGAKAANSLGTFHLVCSDGRVLAATDSAMAEGGTASLLTDTTDFRRVYATLMSSWMGADSQALLNGKFEALPVFA